MEIPNEVWIKILDECDPLSYVRMISSSKVIPINNSQYELKKKEYYVLKSKVVLLEPVKDKYGGITIPIANGLGKALLIQSPFITMPSMKTSKNEGKYELKLSLDSTENDATKKLNQIMEDIDKWVIDKWVTKHQI